ncbi:MAG: hypothetical protein ACJ8KC_09030, partial [Candidatus Udaeobacter sp.]
ADLIFWMRSSVMSEYHLSRTSPQSLWVIGSDCCGSCALRRHINPQPWLYSPEIRMCIGGKSTDDGTRYSFNRH